MRNKFMRSLSAFLCLVLTLSGIPVFAEEGSDVVIAEVIPSEATLAPTEAPVELSLETAAPTEVPVEATEAPVETAAPEASEIPAETPAATPEASPEIVPAETVSAEPTAEASAEPSTEPSIEPSVEPSTEPTLTPEELAVQQESQLSEAVSLWISAMNEAGCDTEFDRAYWLYAGLISNVTPGSADSAYAALIEGSANSLGYARALEKLLAAAGMECMTVSDANDPSVAWNIARLDGEWTHIDAAADDAAETSGAHFGLTDAVMAPNRSWSADVPACTSARNSYFVRMEGYLAVESAESLAALLNQAVEAATEELRIFNAANLPLETSVPEILFEIAPAATSFVEASGCTATVGILYEAPALMTLAAPLALTPEQIIPASDTLVLGVQETASVAGWTLLPEGAQDEITYSSKSSSIASVNAEGLVTGKKVGSTIIYITAASGISCEVAVQVKKAPTSIKITGGRTPLGVDELLQLGYSLSSGSAGTATFTSSDESIVLTTPDGLLVPLAPGNVTITAQTYNKKKHSAKLEIKPAPTSIELGFTYLDLGVGDSRVLPYTLNEGCAGAVTFSSSDESIATVDQDGRITAVSAPIANPDSDGTVEITAQTYNGLAAVCKVKVNPAPTSIQLEISPHLWSAERSTSYTTIGVNEKVQVAPILNDGSSGTIKYKSSKSSIASVDASGMITGKKAGTATITATAHNGVKATIKITVVKAPSSVKITGTRTPLGVGETLPLGYKLSSGSAGRVDYSCSNHEILQFAPEDSILAVAEGTADITATTYNGRKHTVSIEVKPAPTAVIPAVEAVSIGAKDTYTLGYSLNEGAAGAVTYASSDETIATVDQSGKITTHQPGPVDITITAFNGVYGVCHVTVVPEPTAITLTAERTSIGLKEKVQIVPVLEPAETTGTIKYKSSKSSIASVDKNGLVTAKKTGTVTITAETYNKKKATIKITVRKAPSSVKITGARTPLGVGETLNLGYSLSSGSTGIVTFASGNDQVIFADSNGGLLAHAEGTADITATTYNGKKHTVSIEVKPAPTAVIPAVESVSIGAKDTFTLGYSLNEGAAGAVTYASSDETIATVDQSGKITTQQPGPVDITITAFNGVYGVCHVTVVPEPTAITLTAERTSIGLKEKVQIVPVLEPAETTGTIKYKSSKSSIASVDKNGLVTAKKTGTVTITAETYNKKKATIKITVRKAPSSVKITGSRTPLGVGETLNLGYSLSSGSTGIVTFASGNDQVIFADSNGGLLAHAEGTADITATTYNGKKHTVSIEVKPAPTAVIPAVEAVSIGAKDTYTLGYSLNEGAAGAVTYASSDETIATVDQSGKITTHQPGSVDITITAFNGVYGVCHVTVVPEPTAITLTAERTSIGLKEKVQLKPVFSPDESVGTVKYKSSKSSIASVDKNGLVTAKKAGTVTITAETYNKKKATIKITVRKAPSSVKLVAERNIFCVGELTSLGYTLSSGSSGYVSFAGSDDSVALVTPDGLLVAMAPGTVTVTATTYNGKSAAMDFTICPEPTGVSLAETEKSICAGDVFQLVPSVDTAPVCGYSYSADSNCVEVSPTGLVTAKEAGEATITVTTYNDLSCTFRATVLPAPTSIALTAERTSIGLKEKLQLIPVFEEGSAECSIKYKSSKSSIASVDANGLVTAKKTGTVTITVTTYNGVKGTIKITVKKAPSSVKLVAARTVLGAGESIQLGYSLSSGSAGAVTFTDNDETGAVLEVHAGGLLNAYNPGEAQVTATTFNGKKASLNFIVMEAPTSIRVDKPELVLGVGQKDMVTATLNENSAGAIHYRSEHPEIASVDPASGAITAVAPGATRIVSYTYVDGVEAYTDVVVKPAPSFVSMPFTSLNIGVGDTAHLDPQIDEGSAAAFKYKSSNTKYAKVSADGLITALRTGKVTITITTHNNKSCKLTLNIKKAPSSVKLAPSALTLGVGEIANLTATITSGSTTTLRYASADPTIADVAVDGMVFGLSEGSTTITATTHNGKTSTSAVTVVPAPEAISLSMPEVLGVGMTAQLQTQLVPENSHSALSYEVVSGDAVTVDANGKLTAVKEGIAEVRVSTYVSGVYAQQQVTVKPAPESISFGTDKISVNVDETVQLSPILPDGCYTTLTYTVKKSGIFTIDENGLVTPIMRGSSVVTVTTHNGLSATVTLWVVDPYFPESISLSQTPPTYLNVGDKYQPKVEIFPETSIASLKWTSSAPSTVSVDETTGELLARSTGNATIKAVSTRNPALTISFKIVVLSEERCLTMPARKTGTSSIDSNMQKIRNVRESAYRELEKLYSLGTISKTDYNNRKAIIDRAFEMYLFPWMTETLEPYWSEANSEDGAKDFKPGYVYYGVPYTQNNRKNYPTSLIKAGYYTDSGKGYYLMNGSKFTNRYYPGSDCSSFASMATWGYDSSHATDNTTKIANADYYRTITDWTDLRPGDMINRSGRHSLIFLYYANAAKTQIVIIDQGGGEWDTNTVSTSIRAISKYNSTHEIRRADFLE